MSIFAPTLHAKGLFRLGAPLEALLNPELEYSCTGLRTLADVAASGVDVFETYYAPLQLTTENLDNDTKSGAYLVTLQAGVAPPITVPSTYFVERPDIGGIPYRGFGIGIDLSLLPSDIDLAPLKQRLEEIVLETIGVEAVTRTLVTTPIKNKSQDEHAIIEATRENNTTHVLTDWARFVAERDRADSLQQRLTALTEWVQTNRPDQTP